jgi:DNA-binding NarL/FixJ family response regulator
MVANDMKSTPSVLVPIRALQPRPDPTFTTEEAIIMRALVAGKTDKEIRNNLRLPANSFYRVMRDLREKTGTDNNLSLSIWAQRRMKNCDQRVNTRDRYERPVSMNRVA